MNTFKMGLAAAILAFGVAACGQTTTVDEPAPAATEEPAPAEPAADPAAAPTDPAAAPADGTAPAPATP